MACVRLLDGTDVMTVAEYSLWSEELRQEDGDCFFDALRRQLAKRLPVDHWYPLLLGVLFGCARKIAGDSWFTWCFCFFFSHLPGRSIYIQPKRTPRPLLLFVGGQQQPGRSNYPQTGWISPTTFSRSPNSALRPFLFLGEGSPNRQNRKMLVPIYSNLWTSFGYGYNPFVAWKFEGTCCPLRLRRIALAQLPAPRAGQKPRHLGARESLGER